MQDFIQFFRDCINDGMSVKQVEELMDKAIADVRDYAVELEVQKVEEEKRKKEYEGDCELIAELLNKHLPDGKVTAKDVMRGIEMSKEITSELGDMLKDSGLHTFKFTL